ncbi:hypothetical protein OAJ45_03815 [Candidatus Poseidoniales archaeon]|nr:hypothetical protein [Candidatus Poseidoniales archaeon]
MNKLRQTITTLSIVVMVSLLISETILFDSKELRGSGDYYSQRDVLTNDAGTGEDAGMYLETALTLEVENIGSRSYNGDLSNDIDDWRDVYLITPPDDYFVCIELSWDGTFNLGLLFGDGETGNVTKSSRNGGNYNPEVVTHNNFDNETFFIGVSIENENETGLLEYQISIYVDDTPIINSICQDDAGYGRDAYAGDSTLHTEIVPILSPGLTSTSGYISVDEDEWDTYHMFVPNNKGLAVWLYFDDSLVDIKISMFQDPDEDSLDFSHDNYPEMVSSNGSDSFPGGIVENLVVYIHVGVESGSGEYTLYWWLFELDYDEDGVIDENDAFPEDASEWSDIDSDGIGNNADTDDDGDGWSDNAEIDCVSNPVSSESFPTDFDDDGICDRIDNDDDNDGFTDNEEITCGSNPINQLNTPILAEYDYDGDDLCNNMDSDDDNDGFPDEEDDFPLFASEWKDTDGDGLGDNSDQNDDGDLCPDKSDLFPLDSTECIDSDDDGVGNNADVDDDNDGWFDEEEQGCGDSDPLDQNSIPMDSDNDGECDLIDIDDDNDSVEDWNDACPGFNDNLDFDDDGQPDDCDSDDDGDGVIDELDLCQSLIRSPLWLALSISDDSIDNDEDGIPDGCDLLIDSDGDLTSDEDDACEGYDDTLDVDSDGIPDACDNWHPSPSITQAYLTMLIIAIFTFSTFFAIFRTDIK